MRDHPAWRYWCRHVPTGTVYHRVWDCEDINREVFLELINRWNRQQPETWAYVAM